MGTGENKAPVFTLDARLTRTDSGDETILRKVDAPDSGGITIKPAKNPGLWLVSDYTQPNGFDVTLSAGYTSIEEALNAAQDWILTGAEAAPAGEPTPAWIDEAGRWRALRFISLWPIGPRHGMLELEFLGEGTPANDGCALLLRQNEMELPGADAVLEALHNGIQPRVSIVERRLMPRSLFFEFRVKASLEAL
ncbi:MAG: hypothetical protein WCJ78_05835 [Chloroflexota bacterium]|jgi:hypothetical protein